MKPYKVILVVDRNFGDKLREIDFLTPVWIVDSIVNHSAIATCVRERDSESYYTGISSFPDHLGTEPEDLAESFIDTIEDHHGKYAHTPPFSELRIYGAKASPSLLSVVQTIGFDLISEDCGVLEFARTLETEPIMVL